MAPQSIFKDESKLDINYIPAQLPHRESQQRLLWEFFSFILRCPERMSQRVILTGDVGTGKTALAQHFGATMTTEANKKGLKFRYIYVNCREFRGLLQPVLINVIKVFRPNFPTRGYGIEEVLGMLMQMLDEEETCLILTLDEFDSLIEKEGSDTVYKLTRLQEMRQGKPQRISFIFIMRDLLSTQKLDDSARSTLQRSIIRLERYGKPQLVDILSDRVKLAFELSTVSEDVIDLVAELAYSETGNARFGIELLWRAGKYADAGDAEMLEPECVRQAMSSIVPSLRRSELNSLSFHERLFLLATARYFKENAEAYVPITELEKAYSIVCEEFNEQPKSHTQIWYYIQYLSKLGVLKTEVTSDIGRSTKISLPSIPAEELKRQLEEGFEYEWRQK
ncbi:MAG: ORC1-type DNA replication protein [Crenarchaeota archaeon]|nr:ORC1-type DNA replication protein [Thermoproteota archaeon]